MEKTEVQRLIEEMPNKGLDLNFDYQDGDILIVNSVKCLNEQEGPDAIKPNMNIVAFCKKGKMQMEVNGESYEFQRNQVFVCPSGTVIDHVMISPDFEFSALGITNQMLQLCLRSYIGEWNRIMYIKKLRVFTQNEDDLAILEKSYALVNSFMNRNVAERDKGKLHEIIRGFVAAGLLGLSILLSEKVGGEEVVPPKQNISLFNRFLDLLQATEYKHQPVDFYASKLCISVKYLTEICKKNSGKTAKDWIREYTIADIAYYLGNTSLSVKEVCVKVGFPNNSFLCKYVKDTFGCSPLEYRLRKQSNK